jgi:hypothetical protein
VVGVDQLATELDHLPIGKMIAQAEHATTDAALRLEQSCTHPGLPQAPGRGEAGDAGADDDDLFTRRRQRPRHLCASRQQHAGTCALQQATPRGIDPKSATMFVELVQGFARMRAGAGDACSALQQGKQRGAAHAWLLSNSKGTTAWVGSDGQRRDHQSRATLNTQPSSSLCRV